MIVAMRKVTLLLRKQYREEALKRLRKLGVLHIKHLQLPESNDIDRLISDSENSEKALRVMTTYEVACQKGSKKKPEEIVKEILSLSQERSRLIRELNEIHEIYIWFETWGKVSLQSIQTLRDADIFIRFYKTDKSTLKKIDPEKNVQIIKEDRGTLYIAFFAETEADRLDVREDPMPKFEYTSLEFKGREIEKKISQIERTLKNLAVYNGVLETYQVNLKKQLEFNRVKYGMAEEEELVCLQGFCPIDQTSSIKKTADEEEWGYMIEEPDDPAEVPTLLRNPKSVRIINPLFKFMGALPGYHEQDISFWFLLFLSLFFAILIGDAGYGLIFIGLTLFASHKMKNAPREVFQLMTLMSTTTIIWGIISGNWFGYEKIAQIPFLQRLVVDQINSFANDNQTFMMFLCFIIGIIHLTIAHLLNAVRSIHSLKCLAEIGWVGILWSLFFITGNLVLQRPLPGFTLTLFFSGFLLTLVFSNFQKNIFKGVLSTLLDLPLNIISSFSDLVSYIRLFAVGSASVAVAVSFNDMALGVGIHTIIRGFIAALVLFLGHGLNILLGLMSVIVHGVRLNMLEFSGHLNMQWAGKDYQPFHE